MSWPDITFTEEEKIKFQKMALALEQRIAIDGRDFPDLARFSEYPPFVRALNLAKEKKIDKPVDIPNTNYWYFETNLQEWMRFEGTGMLSGFLLAIEGFPYEDQSGNE